MTTVLSAQRRREMVTSLVKKGILQSPAIQHAFLTIPREAFVPSFFEQHEGTRLEWTYYHATHIAPEDYLQRVYADQPLITKLNERRLPISSSSMPSIMAKMLEALDILPGQNVLEIGTGTGYNAALLSLLTGSPTHVVTIDIDPVLTGEAKRALEHVVGSGVTVITGDGFRGYPEGAPYDRIIVTASLSMVPMSFVDQLSIGGQLVMNLQGALTGVVLVLRKTTEGTSGHFLAEPSYFMPLNSTNIPILESLSSKNLPQNSDQVVLPEEHVYPDILSDVAFGWFLQWRIPGCQVIKIKPRQQESRQPLSIISVIDPHNRAIARFQLYPHQTQWTVSTYGSPHFWERLVAVYAEFIELGEPQPHHYRFVIEEQPLVMIGSLKLPI